MVFRLGTSLMLAVGLCGSVEAQDGGKIPWKGKRDDVKAALAEAQKEGRAVMMFFTSEG